jgi:hypothetical protein
MDLVCSKCKRIFRDGEWVVDLLPIQKCSMTVCPRCTGSSKPKQKKDKHGMVYQEYQKKKNG